MNIFLTDQKIKPFLVYFATDLERKRNFTSSHLKTPFPACLLKIKGTKAQEPNLHHSEDPGKLLMPGIPCRGGATAFSYFLFP